MTGTINDSTRTKASTADILGGRRMPKIPTRWKSAYENLLRVRDSLIHIKHELTQSAKEEHQTFSLHIGDVGTDQYDTDFALSMASSEQAVLYEVEQALTRISNGSYGICELTGEEIEAERLQAIPWARFSKDAQVALEQKGLVGRTKLASLSNIPNFQSAETEEEPDED